MISAEDEMGRIIPRRSKSGTTGYPAQLLIKRKGTIISLQKAAHLTWTISIFWIT
jgi:hypothetical protein